MRRSSVVLGAFVGCVAIGCPGAKKGTSGAAKGPEVGETTAEPIVVRVSKTGLGFRLSDADGETESRHPKPALATPLGADETKRLLDRLPPFKADANDAQAFALRGKSLPAPRPGETVKEPFPPLVVGAATPAQATGPLRVIRHEPDGDVALAPYWSVTFNAPMVPVTSHQDLAEIPVPIRLTPEPPGKWRWVGTQTAMFQPDGRFPMATEYAVDIDAGTKSAMGAVLPAAEHYRFATPAPRVVGVGPSGESVGLNPLIYIRFDQAIEPEAMLRSMQVTENGRSTKVRLATQSEMDDDQEFAAFAGRASPGEPLSLGVGDYHPSAGGQYGRPSAKAHIVAIKPAEPFSASATITVKFPAGTGGAEGPRKTLVEQSGPIFKTHGPLRAIAHECRDCNPFSAFEIRYSNSLEAAKFDAKWIRIDPPIADVKATASGSYLVIQGRKKGKTQYKVTIARGLSDVFGQTLQQDDVHVFDVGPAESALFSEVEPMIVLDPAAGHELSVFSVNDPTLRVRLYAVKPEDYPAYLKWRQDWGSEGKVAPAPGTLVATTTLQPAKNADELTETKVDLGPALKDNFGQVLAVVETTRPARERWQKQWVRQWLQVTHIGLQATADASSVVAWTTALGDGAPLPGVAVTTGESAGTSAEDGTVHLLADRGEFAARRVLIARRGNDTTFLPDSLVVNAYRPNPLRFFTFDDRKTYKPGEAVHVKGWVRALGYLKGGDVALDPDASKGTLRWVAHDARGAELSKGETKVDTLGGFDFVATTPTTANLGQATVTLEIVGRDTDKGWHPFQLQEFRRPEFEVSAEASSGPHFVGEHATATVRAKYYAGGGLPDADVSWTVTRREGAFTPPNRREYAFGKREWTWFAEVDKTRDRTRESWTGHTDSQGVHRMRIDFDALDPSYPMSLSLTANVTDVNRQAWGANTVLLVHPADVYVGLKLDKPFVNAGESIHVDTLVVDLDGKAVAKRAVVVKSTRLDWEQTPSGYKEKEVDEQVCAVTSADEPLPCTLAARKGGQYRLRATVEDEYGRKSQTVTRAWVMDPGAPPQRNLREDSLEITADKKAYAGGDTAELLVVSPFVPAEGTLVVARQGIVATERFHMTSSMQTLNVKIDDKWVPNAHAFVFLAGARARENASGVPDESLPKRPAYASGSIELAIPPTGRTLKVDVSPRDHDVDPGGRTMIDVDVKDARGAAVSGAEVAVIVVDESILALSDYELPNPIAEFYPSRAACVADAGTRRYVTLPKPGDVARARGGPGGPWRGDTVGDSFGAGGLGLSGVGEGGGGRGEGIGLGQIGTLGHGAAVLTKPQAAYAPQSGPMASAAAPAQATTPIALRTHFDALALFEPAKVTDSHGHLEVPVKLPDSLTRYRVMAVAAARMNEFGSHESTITVRLPLMVRPSAPRFLSFGDQFQFPVVLQNQTAKPMSVSVAIRAQNAKVIDSAGKRIEVPANDRVEVRFLSAAEKPGKARFELAAAAGEVADASDVELPVWTPATTEAFATYGVIDNGAIAQPVKMPSGVVAQFGGLEVTTSSTAMQGLTDAVVYLVQYPFECNEQLASRMLAIASLRDVLAAFRSRDLPTPEALDASMAKDLEKLRTRQKPDGGWAFWWGEEWPFVSVHVAHALARTEAKGYKVDASMKQRAIAGLRDIERRIPSWYGEEGRRGLVAYSLYVRRLLKDADPARARRLLKEYGGVEKANLEALAWIWPTLSEDQGSRAENEQIRRVVGNRATETAGAAHFVTSFADADYLLLHSDRRADAVLLEAMMIDQPDSDLIPKVVKGLLAGRKTGRWGSTQENAFVLLALDKYFEKYEAATPDFIARVWLGDQYVGDHAFKGRGTDSSQIDVPMQILAGIQSADLTVAKEGTGRLYWRVAMQDAPADLRPLPADQGFTVTRTYEAAEDDGDVKRDAGGVWHFKAGKKVRVRVTMFAPSRRYHVALVDPIPAGTEPMNPALAVTGSIPLDPSSEKAEGGYWYWRSTWYEHQNLRDERAEAFAPVVWEGVHEYVYTVRATTPGTFVVGPPKAEEMYSPEVFGRGPGDQVVVE